jgi:hypothetical protein
MPQCTPNTTIKRKRISPGESAVPSLVKNHIGKQGLCYESVASETIC